MSDTTLAQESLNSFNAPDETDREAIAEPLLPAALEAVLFAAGDPIPLDRLAAITGQDRQTLRRVLASSAERYRLDPRRGLLLREIDGNYLLCTKPEMQDVLERMFQPRNRPPLSQAAYETLAIIAYNQPVTRAQIEAVRGVNSDSIVSRLLERQLIREAGSLDAPGRPTLFETTDQFLLDFGLSSVDDLPPMEMLMYGTLRDFEATLEASAGADRDRQMTIDQVVSAFVPEHDAVTPPEPLAETGRPDDFGPAEPTPLQDLPDVSSALFGNDDESDDL